MVGCITPFFWSDPLGMEFPPDWVCELTDGTCKCTVYRGAICVLNIKHHDILAFQGPGTTTSTTLGFQVGGVLLGIFCLLPVKFIPVFDAGVVARLKRRDRRQRGWWCWRCHNGLMNISIGPLCCLSECVHKNTMSLNKAFMCHPASTVRNQREGTMRDGGDTLKLSVFLICLPKKHFWWWHRTRAYAAASNPMFPVCTSNVSVAPPDPSPDPCDCILEWAPWAREKGLSRGLKGAEESKLERVGNPSWWCTKSDAMSRCMWDSGRLGRERAQGWWQHYAPFYQFFGVIVIIKFS